MIAHQNFMFHSFSSTIMNFEISSSDNKRMFGILNSWTILRVFTTTLLVSISCNAFNIKTTDFDFIQQPNDSSNWNGNREPTFFGYDFAFKLNNNGGEKNASFIIGSPKGGTALDSWLIPAETISYEEDDNPNKPGDIFLCGFSFEDGASPCKSINPAAEIPDDPAIMTDGDSSGLTIVKSNPRSDSDDMMICAPLRARNCTSDFLTQGACFASEDYGSEWQSESKQATTHCPVLLVDLIFVLDGSGSVTSSDPRNFDLVKDWVKTVASKFDLRDFAHVGVVQYSHWYNGRDEQPYIKTEIALGQFTQQIEFEMEVDNINIQGYTTYTAHAINKTVDDFMDSERFNDTATKKVMILLTDGRSNDVSDLPVSAAYARSMGITIFAVGVAEFSTKELQIIATGQIGNNQRVYGLQKFSDLQQIVGSLQKSITGILEGSASGNETNDLQNSEIGIAGIIDTNGRLHLGAVGAYDWSGTITKYDSIDDEEPDIPKYADVQAVLPNRTKESYLGYSVITGFFDDTSSEWVAAGAPRYMLMGAVVVYKPQDNSATFHDHVTLMGHPSKRQLGAYFGGSVLTADVNNDGKDDLFVGSPLYVASNYDEGRVFVYVSRPTNSLQAWGKDSYEPLELFGDHLPGGRFGTAMANAGDLNMDGYNDVIVGAPLTEVDRGAVFVYHGNENGVDTQFAQKILASELKGVQLKYFGQSLQGGVDLDGNKYPDIAVGAPKSDTVVIFRSRPVVKIDATIEYLTGDIDIFECIDKNYQNCSRIQVCFTASGTSVETVVGIRFNVTLDIEKAGATKRIEFRKSPDLIASGLPTWTQDLHLAKDNRTCLTKNIHMKSNIADYDSAIKTELEFDLLSSHTEKPLSSVRDPSKVNVKSTLLNFAKRCGNDDKCIHDLRLEASLSLPEYRTESDNKDLTENGKVLIVDQKTADVPVTVKVNLTNNGENAFDTKIKVMYTSLISLSTLDNRQAKPPSNSCIVEDSDPVDVGNGMKSQIFRYNYRTNIMRQYAWCYFEFNLITENLRSNGNLETFTVNVTAFTSDSSSSSSEKNEADNSWGLSPKVKYRSDFSLIKKSVTEIPFNYTSEEYNITSVHEIGGNTPDFEVAFEIRGEGYSNIPEAEATLTYPMKTSQGDMLLYLYKVECKPKSINSKASCSCHQDFVNIHNLTLENPNGNNTDGSYVTITPPEYQIEAKTFNCFNTDPGRNFTCAALQCNIKNLRDSDQMDFIAHFRLWSSSIMFNGTNFTEVELHSRYEVNTVKSPYIIDEKGDISQMQTEEIITKAKKFAESEGTGTQKDYLWIIILAAVGGLLLLIAIVLILWKVGFFKSKYADMKKDAQDDVADESDIQGNGNESTTDMVG